MTKTNKKTKWKYGVLAIVFIVAFVAPDVFQFVDFGTVNEQTQPKSWFDPRLSDFFYDDTINETSYPFNAYNESYIVCKIQNDAYANFTLDETVYNVSYGMNYIPIDFGNENKSYTVTFHSYDILRDIYDWFTVQPVIIEEGFIDINLDTTTDIIFNATGLVSFFITWNCTSFNNFTYDELYVEYDGTTINEQRGDWDDKFNIDPLYISNFRFKGPYIQYDIFMDPGEHIIKLKGNSTVKYKIVVSGDWDGDEISNFEEIQEENAYGENRIFEPTITGFFVKGHDYLYIYDYELEHGLFTFYIPENFNEQILRIQVLSGAIANITVDENDLMFKNVTVDNTIFDYPEVLYYGKVGPGRHAISYEYTKDCLMYIKFYVNQTEIPITRYSGITDTDSDGLTDYDEKNIGTNEYKVDTDGDDLIDGVDSSPLSAIKLNNSKITKIVIPDDPERDTLISMTIDRDFTIDYTTDSGSQIWNDMEVSIFPALRMFGNSTISSAELTSFYEKEVETFDLTGNCPHMGDGVPDALNENKEFTIIKPQLSQESILYTFTYDVNNSAKDDSKLVMQFDFVWVVTSQELDFANIIHWYEIEDIITLQSLNSKEIGEMDYILASPDSAIENQILWTLVQNSDIGSFSDFGVSDDVVASGVSNYTVLFDTLANIRENNPISVDEAGEIDESEVIYLSYLFTEYDILQNISNNLYWTTLTETQEKRCKNELFVSNYISNILSEDDFISSFQMQLLESNLKIHYSKEFGNFSESVGSLEERFEIYDYPIYMNNMSFQTGDILETVNVEGSGIPLDKLPQTIDSEIHDLITITNATIIEDKNQEQGDIPSIFLDDMDDLLKTFSCPRIDIPLSDLIFNTYSQSYINSIYAMLATGLTNWNMHYYWNVPLIGYWTTFLPDNWQYWWEIDGIRTEQGFSMDNIIVQTRISAFEEFTQSGSVSSYYAYLNGLEETWFSETAIKPITLHSIVRDGLDNEFGYLTSQINAYIDDDLEMVLWLANEANIQWRLDGTASFFTLLEQVQDPTGIFDESTVKHWCLKRMRKMLDFSYKRAIKDAIEGVEKEQAVLDTATNPAYGKGEGTADQSHQQMMTRIQHSTAPGDIFNPVWDYEMNIQNVLSEYEIELYKAKDKQACLEFYQKKLDRAIKQSQDDTTRRKLIGDVYDSVYRPSAKNFWTTAAVTGIFGVILIFSAITDFEAARNAFEEGNTEEFLYRGMLGTTKFILGASMTALVVSKMVLRIAGETTKIPLTIMKGLVGIVKYAPVLAQVCGLILDVIMLFDYVNMILESDLPDIEKLGWYIFIGAMFVIGTIVPLVYTAVALVSTATLSFSWIPYIGIPITIITLIIMYIFFPPEGPATGGAAASNAGYIFPENKFKTRGGLEVGDTINFTVDIENTGELTMYMQTRLSAGESTFSDWGGNYQSGYGEGQGETINVGSTLNDTSSYLSLRSETQIAIWTDSKVVVYDESAEGIMPVPILDTTIAAFYDDLTEHPNKENQKSYTDLRSEYQRYKDSYEHNKTAEALDKLSNDLTYDFLGDLPGDQTPGNNDWATTETDENKFKALLRPNQLLYNDIWSPTPDGLTLLECVEDAMLYPNDADPSSFAFGGPLSAGMNYGLEDLSDAYPTPDRIKQIKVYVYYRAWLGFQCQVSWRNDSGKSWSSPKEITGIAGAPWVWQTFTWTTDTTSDLQNVQIRFYNPPLGHDVQISSFYVEIMYTSTMDDPDPELVSEYKGYNNVMNVTAFGQYANTEFYHDLGQDPGPQSSGIIDFWMNKDNYSNVIFDTFLQIDRAGSILNYDGTSYVRERPIWIDEWTHFSIDFDSDSFDLYVNGIQYGNDITRESGDVSTVSFTVFNNFDPLDSSMGNISVVYFDAINYDWDSDWYQWQSFAYDYSQANITYYTGIHDALIINTSISTDLRKNVVEMSTSTHIADFDFYFDLVGTEYPDIDIELFNLPDGFSFSTTHIDQNLEDEVSFTITNTEGLQYAGVYYFEMNVTLNGDSEIIYHEIVPFIIPYVEDLSFEQQNVIYEEDDISSGEYTATYSFTGDTGDPDDWYVDGYDPQVVSGYGEHNDVVKFHDTGIDVSYMYKDLGTITTNGTIEFWLQKSSEDVNGNSLAGLYIFMTDGAPGSGITVRVDWQNNEKIQAWYSGGYKDVFEGIYDDVWNHLKFELDLYSDTYNIYLNDILVGDSVPFTAGISSFDSLVLYTSAVEMKGDFYVDAIGHTWDPDYKIGDNLHETDILIEDITESQVTKGDIVNVDFITNTYAEVQMSFVNNDAVQEVYTILPRGNYYSGIQMQRIIINKSVTFDEIRFTEFEYNYFDVLRVLITDSFGSVGTLFNPVNITNDGNTPEYVLFDISRVGGEDSYSMSSPGIVDNVNRGDSINWVDVNEVKIEDNNYTSNTITISGGGGSGDSTQSPGTAANVDRNGKGYWSAPNNAKTSNNQDTNSFFWSATYNDWLRVTNFGFNIPEGATIDGIKVRIERAASSSDKIKDSSLRLRKTSGQVGDDNADTSTYWTTSDTYAEYGGSTDTWSAGLTYSDINSADFGVDFSAQSVSSWKVAYVDHIEITVYYTESGGSSETESDILRCTDFDFGDSIPDDATIAGVVVEIDKHASVASTIKDYEIRLRKPNGDNSSNKKSSEYWDTTDAYEVYGSFDDTWNLDLTYNDVVNPNFGVDIAVKNHGASSIAYIDHVRIKIYYSKSFTMEILPGETVEMNFTIEVPTESINNLIYREIEYQTLGSNTIHRYIDNFAIDGIYIASPMNTKYNIIGENGYYPATYGFENEEIGDSGTNIDFVDSDGTSSPSTLTIISGDLEHKNIIEMYDGSTATRSKLTNNFDTSQEYGSIEYWVKSTDVSKRFMMVIYSDSTMMFGIQFENNGVDRWQYYSGGSWTTFADTPVDNVWYHIRLDFEFGSSGYQGLSADTWQAFINGVKYGAYSRSGSTINKIEMKTDSYSDSGYSCYIDAVGYSWDNEYTIGDNKEQGLLLDIISEETLVWSAYSLNGQANTTFSNRDVLSIPETNGMHSIQVFGEDAGEVEYESELRNFTIRYPIGIVSPNETENTIFHEFLEDYDSFDSNDVNSEPDNWTVVNSESENTMYITDIDPEYGFVGGTISNAQIDDSNYFSLSSQFYLGEYVLIGTFDFNIAPGYRDFLVSYHVEATASQGSQTVDLKVNDATWKSGESLNSDNVLKSGINTVSIEAHNEVYSFIIRIYFFKMVDITDEGNAEVIESMNGMYKPVQISNGKFDAEVSMERDFPESYETGNVSFSILRESITDENTALITLSGTSGTMVYTLENDDLYYGTYATKTMLAENVLKQDVWQDFIIFFNVSEGCQIFVDGVNTTEPGVYSPFSTGTPNDINAFKIETVYHSGESYKFWFDNFLVNEIEGGFILDVYNRFVYLDNLEYSFDEGAKKSFTDRELFSFPEDGLHNVTIYGTDFYGDEYRSEFTIFTTGSTCDVFIFSEANEMPTQWSDYSFTYGSAGGTGSTEYNDDIYAYMNAGTIAGSDTYLGSIIPNGNLISGWNEGDGGSHYDLLNEYPLSADGGNIRESGWNVNDRWDFSFLTIPDGAYVSKLEVNGWVMRQSGVYNAIMLTSNCFGGTQWWTPSNGYYSLKTRTITGLNIDQGELNSFYLNVHTLENEPPNGWVDIEYVYINVYYKPINYRFTAEITFTIPSTDLFSIDTFYYDYSLTDTSIYSELNIWNDDSSNWNTNLESDYDQSYTGYYDLTDPYISSSNQVKFQLFTNIQLADFDMRLDQFMITYTKRVKKEL